MKRPQISLSLLCITFFIGCIQNANALEMKHPRYEESRAKTVVFRDLLKGVAATDAPFFLAISGRKGNINPNSKVQRWVGYSKFVHGVSKMERLCQQMRRHIKADGMGFLPGGLFTIYGLKWIAQDQIDIIGSRKFNPCGDGDVGSYEQYLFHLKRDKKNNWIVASKFLLAAAG